MNAIVTQKKTITATKLLSQIVSVVLHPLMLPTLMFLVLLWILPDFRSMTVKTSAWLLITVHIFTFAIPGIVTYILYFTGWIKNIRLEERKDRYLPMITTIIIYVFFAYLIKARLAVLGHLPLLLIISVTISIFITLLVTLFWKISAHGVGIGGFVGVFSSLSFYYPDEIFIYLIMASWLLAGCLLSARLYLQAHTISQVAVGFVAGFIINFVAVLFF